MYRNGTLNLLAGFVLGAIFGLGAGLSAARDVRRAHEKAIADRDDAWIQACGSALIDTEIETAERCLCAAEEAFQASDLPNAGWAMETRYQLFFEDKTP